MRLADFGLSGFADATLVTHTSNNAGSIRWMAPELHIPEIFDLKELRRTAASDVYALACVALEVCSRSLSVFIYADRRTSFALRFTQEIIHSRIYFVMAPSF